MTIRDGVVLRPHLARHRIRALSKALVWP